MSDLDHKALFAAIRDVANRPLTQADVDKINAVLGVEPPVSDEHNDGTHGSDGYLTPEALIRGYIGAHEGVLSLDRADTGNFYKGALIGSKYGVTGNALAAYRAAVGNATPVNRETMAALTLDEAVAVGVHGYYRGGVIRGARFDLLPWNRVTMIGVDLAWGSGAWGAKLIQRLAGVPEDGIIGPATAAAYSAYLTRVGEEEAARRLTALRLAYYQSIPESKGRSRFIRGWTNRANSFLPGTPWWKGAKL